MSRGGGRAGRHVTPDEAALWSHATHSLARVKAKPRVATQAADAAPAPPSRSPGTAAGRAKPPRAAPPGAVAQPPATAGATPLAGFDRRTLRQVSAGRVAIDARLDLHGMQRSDAHARLRAFLTVSRAKGHRMLLIITGKGGDADTKDHLAGMLGRPQRGVLRRSVPQWLEDPEFRAIVLSYTTASQRHGGDGALYVRLRKARDT